MVPTITTVAFAALTLFATLAQAQPPRPILAALEPSGPNGVGRQLLHWADSARRDPMDSTRVRELMVWVWYPAAKSGSPRETALPGAWGERHAAESAARIDEGPAAALRSLAVHARIGAAIAGPAKHPVLLFTPGLGWLPSDYSALAEDLASHGYVVFGIAPTGLVDVVLFPDGREVKRGLGIGERIGVDQAHAHHDAHFALVRIRHLAADAAGPFGGRLDLGRLGAFGHSLGGTTSLVLATLDGSVRAAVNIDGDPMGSVLEVRPRQPLLLISSESPPHAEIPPNPDPRHVELVKAGLDRSEARRTGDWLRISRDAAAAYRIRVLGSRHSNFSDLSLAAPLITDPRQRWMRFGPIDGTRSLRITADLVRHFFDHTLNGAPAELLLHPERTFPEARVEG